MVLTLIRECNYFLLELFIFLRALSQSTSSIALSLLVQDKICLYRYNETDGFCQYINDPMKNAADQVIKNHVLAEATQFMNYKNFLECVPMVIWSLFIGSFLDSYKGGTRLILIAGVLGDLFALIIWTLNAYSYQSNLFYILIGSISTWFTGGMTSFLTTIYSYIALNSTDHNRPIKFMLVRFSNFMGISLGTFIGGHMILLVKQPSPQIRTYYWNFALSIGVDLALVGILLIFFRLAASRARESQDENEPINESEEEEQPVESESGFRKFSRVFFSLDNLRQTLKCFVKPRAGHARLQIHLLYLVLFSQVVIYFGVQDVLLQFCEKVYFWDPAMYSNLSSASKIISTLLLAGSSYFLVERWRLADGTIIWWALISSFFGEIIVGTFLSPVSFYISIPVGALSGFSLISIRSKLSKLVPAEEIGKILSLSSTLEAVIPFLSSFIYSNLFALTIATYPSAIFHFSAVIVLASLFVMLWEEYC